MSLNFSTALREKTFSIFDFFTVRNYWEYPVRFDYLPFSVCIMTLYYLTRADRWDQDSYNTNTPEIQ